MNKELLIVDKDKIFAESLKYSLEQDNYNGDITESGKLALDKIDKKDYDLIIQELKLPDMDGIDLCKNIRKLSYAPIIIVTDNDEDMTKVLALEYGADDYLVKPFNILELKARIKSIFRRASYKIEGKNKHILKYENFSINTLRRKVTIEDSIIDLTGKEFDLFYTLSTNPGKIFTREELLEKVWGYAYYGDLRTVDVHIRRIREKLEKKVNNSDYIMTKWGVGYYFNNH